MKKAILSWLLIGTSCALYAQTTINSPDSTANQYNSNGSTKHHRRHKHHNSSDMNGSYNNGSDNSSGNMNSDNSSGYNSNSSMNNGSSTGSSTTTGSNNGNSSSSSNGTYNNGSNSSGTWNGTRTDTTGNGMNGTYNNGSYNNGMNGTSGNGTYNNGMNGSNSTGTSSWNNRDSLGGNNMQSSGNYSAYGASAANVPSYVQQNFMTTYPSAGNVRWQQSGTDWWRASYMDNGQPRNIYYNTNGTSFTVALPVLETQVPQDVISRVNNMYGADVYDIAQVKGANGTNQYVVRTIQNGQLTTKYINEDGTAVTNMSSNGSYGAYGNGSMNNGSMNNGSMNNGSMNNGSMNNSNSGVSNSTTTDSTGNSNYNSSGMNNSSSTDNSTTTGTTTDNSASSTDNNSSNSSTNQGKMKLKVVNGNGKEVKTKMKNGKVITKSRGGNNGSTNSDSNQ